MGAGYAAILAVLDGVSASINGTTFEISIFAVIACDCSDVEFYFLSRGVNDWIDKTNIGNG